jgi:hypothetical protein
MEKEEMTVNEKQLVGHVDVTPTWESLVDIIAESLASGDAVRWGVAHTELRRMAQAADAWNAHQRGGPRS